MWKEDIWPLHLDFVNQSQCQHQLQSSREEQEVHLIIQVSCCVFCILLSYQLHFFSAVSKVLILFIYIDWNESMDPSCFVSPAQPGGGAVRVWGAFSWHTLGHLCQVSINKNGTAHLCVVVVQLSVPTIVLADSSQIKHYVSSL